MRLEDSSHLLSGNPSLLVSFKGKEANRSHCIQLTIPSLPLSLSWLTIQFFTKAGPFEQPIVGTTRESPTKLQVIAELRFERLEVKLSALGLLTLVKIRARTFTAVATGSNARYWRFVALGEARGGCRAEASSS